MSPSATLTAADAADELAFDLDFDIPPSSPLATPPNEPPTSPPVLLQPSDAFTTITACDYLYIDIETVPDESRLESFGLPPVEVMPPTLTVEQCPDPSRFVTQTVPEQEKWLADNVPPNDWIDAVVVMENQGKKPRKGVMDAIEAFRKRIATIANAEADRCKLLSVTPEYCRLASLGMACGDGPVIVETRGTRSEEWLLEWFWRAVERSKAIVTFNGNHFDLPVLFVRSMLLDAAPSRLIDLTPWKGQAIDLAHVRWPEATPKKLKPWAKSLGVEIPAGDCDGGRVIDLVRDEKWSDLAIYNASDVEVTRAVHRKLRGYFTP